MVILPLLSIRAREALVTSHSFQISNFNKSFLVKFKSSLSNQPLKSKSRISLCTHSILSANPQGSSSTYFPNRFTHSHKSIMRWESNYNSVEFTWWAKYPTKRTDLQNLSKTRCFLNKSADPLRELTDHIEQVLMKTLAALESCLSLRSLILSPLCVSKQWFLHNNPWMVFLVWFK